MEGLGWRWWTRSAAAMVPTSAAGSSAAWQLGSQPLLDVMRQSAPASSVGSSAACPLATTAQLHPSVMSSHSCPPVQPGHALAHLHPAPSQARTSQTMPARAASPQAVTTRRHRSTAMRWWASRTTPRRRRGRRRRRPQRRLRSAASAHSARLSLGTGWAMPAAGGVYGGEQWSKWTVKTGTLHQALLSPPPVHT